MKPGLLLQGVVRSIDRTRKVVYLSSDPDTVSKCIVCFFLFYWFYYLVALIVSHRFPRLLTFFFGFALIQTKDLKGISIDLLVPGMMVSTRVQSILENGVMLSFLTYFTGTVSIFCVLII